jgi:outer membrane protein assembly factor BamB
MNRVRRALVAATLLFATGHVVPAEPLQPESANLRGDSAQTRKRLNEADQKLAAGQAADAIDALQRVLDDAGDDLVTIDGKQYRPARLVAHQLLSHLPADALKGYQDRIDDPARKLLELAKKNRDPGPLWQLVDRYFVSRPTDEGLLLLGDLLFERGEFRTAAQIWKRLLPDANADVTYPNSKADQAAVQARIILAAIFGGEIARAKTELAAFKQKYASAKGNFAGKDGLYADTLQAILDAPPKLPPTANQGLDWPTFGGGPDRSGRVGRRLTAKLMGQPTWEKTILAEGMTAIPRHESAPRIPPARPPFGHPIIANGQVFVTDGCHVLGFDLIKGDATCTLTLLDPRELRSRAGSESTKPTPDACPTLTAAGDRLYVRVGAPLVRAPDPAKFGKGDETAIVCLGPKRKDERELKQLWKVRPPAGESKAPTAWEGAPLVADRRMWAAYARFEGGRVIHGIACYDPADATTAPQQPAWTTEICDSPLLTVGDGRPRQELLTLAGRNIIFCSNSGAVIAVDALTGRRSWAFRYPRARKTNASISSNPSPAVTSDGHVFVAPADGERVYALDAETGEVLWESGATEGAQIVGVSDGKLIVTVNGPVRGLRALSLTNGLHSPGNGWVQHDSGGQHNYGHGFVTDTAIVWPTQTGLYYCNPHDGQLGTRITYPNGPVQLQGFFGNIAYADGVLVVVTPTEVWAYVDERKRFAGLEERSSRDPVRSRFESLMDKAESALAAGETKTARESLLAASQGDFPRPFRAWATARLLLLTPKTDSEAKLPADLRAALTAELKGEWLLSPDGMPTTLGAMLAQHLGQKAPELFLPASLPASNERTAEDLPSLSPDAEINRTVSLQPGAAPLRWILGGETPPRRLFFATDKELIGVSLTRGEKCRHDSPDAFTHAADIAEGFVVAGPVAVAVYGNARAPLWVFRVPTTDPLPSASGEFRICTDDVPPVAELSSFRLLGSWLVARLGERHLIALDLKSKQVAWVLGASGKPGYRPVGFPDSARFGSEFFASGRLIVVQLSDGKRWFIRVETGKVLTIPGFDQPTAKVWWTLQPAEVEGNRLAVSDGAGVVRLLNLLTGRVKWTHQEERETSLSGEPPQVQAWGEVLVMAVRRNHGVEIERLNISDGKSAWRSEGPAFLDADRVTLSNADADSERVYVPAENQLSAFTLKDGKTAWEAPLPDTHGSGGWVVKVGQKCLIVYPEAAIAREPFEDALARVVRSFRSVPQARRLPGLIAGLYDAWVTRSVPVLLLDPETGKQLGKIDIPGAGPAITTWFERDLAVVATGNHVCWLR